MGQLVFLPLLYSQKAVKKTIKNKENAGFHKTNKGHETFSKNMFLLNDGFTKYLVLAQSIQLTT